MNLWLRSKLGNIDICIMASKWVLPIFLDEMDWENIVGNDMIELFDVVPLLMLSNDIDIS